MPDIDLSTDDGPTRLFTLLHDARPLLLDLAGGGDPTPWSDRIRVVEATGPDQLELPVVGPVAPPAAVLVRPDGHVAWTGGLDDPQLPAAIDTWFGAGP